MSTLKAVNGYAEVAAYLTTDKQNPVTENSLRIRHHRKQMPTPDGTVGGSPVWLDLTVLRAFPDRKIPAAIRSDRGVSRGPRA